MTIGGSKLTKANILREKNRFSFKYTWGKDVNVPVLDEYH